MFLQLSACPGVFSKDILVTMADMLKEQIVREVKKCVCFYIQYTFFLIFNQQKTDSHKKPPSSIIRFLKQKKLIPLDFKPENELDAQLLSGL